MGDPLNVLILSCGTRNKIIEYFKKELKNKGKVYATDNSLLAPALYAADDYFIVPKIDEESYLEHILEICEKYQIKGVFSLIDPELLLLAEHKQKFLNIGTIPIISSYELIEKSFNKYQFNEYLKASGFNSMKSYLELSDFYHDYEKLAIDFPVFVKPVQGSASLNINVVHSKEELKILFLRHDDLMIQQFMNGTEYGIDIYVDLYTKEPVSVFIKEKIKMRAGETDKSVSIKDEELLKVVLDFLDVTSYVGTIDMDLFKIEGKYYISEINPRFGGGYPHGYELGVNIPRQLINNLEKKQNPVELNNYESGVYMMKYNELIVNKNIE